MLNSVNSSVVSFIAVICSRFHAFCGSLGLSHIPFLSRGDEGQGVLGIMNVYQELVCCDY